MDQPERICSKHGKPMKTRGKTNAVYFLNGEAAPGWDYVCDLCTRETGKEQMHTYLMLPVEVWPKS